MNKIQLAVEKCVSYAVATDRPFLQVCRFLDALKSEPGWTQQEIAQVQVAIVRALMAELNAKSPPSTNSAPSCAPLTTDQSTTQLAPSGGRS